MLTLAGEVDVSATKTSVVANGNGAETMGISHLSVAVATLGKDQRSPTTLASRCRQPWLLRRCGTGTGVGDPDGARSCRHDVEQLHGAKGVDAVKESAVPASRSPSSAPALAYEAVVILERRSVERLGASVLRNGIGQTSLLFWAARMGDAARVAALAEAGDPLGRKAFEIFVELYGPEAGNMALRVLARGGFISPVASPQKT